MTKFSAFAGLPRPDSRQDLLAESETISRLGSGKECLVSQAIATEKFNCGDRFTAGKNLTILKSGFSRVVK